MDASLVLEDFISRSRIPHIIYRLKSHSLVVFFRMVHNENIFKSPSVKCRTFSERPTRSDLFPFCSYKKRELSKNFSMHCKNREFSGPYNFLTPIKSSILDV